MQWARWQQSPWGEITLVGLSWDVAWVALAAGLLTIAAHIALYNWRWRAAQFHVRRSPQTSLGPLPERLLRHTLVSRIIHWAMALAVSVLLLTAFLPIMGINFAWVTVHWLTGFALTGIILFHLLHATLWKSASLMWITRQDLGRGWAMVRSLFDPRVSAAKPGKNPLENKLFHHAVALAGLAAVASGLVIMVNVDTPWWNRNPFLLSDDQWGLVYLIHGAGAVALVALILVHVYFALRPERLWITQSMFRGWITREHFLEWHDPRRWQPGPMTAGTAPRSAASEEPHLGERSASRGQGGA